MILPLTKFLISKLDMLQKILSISLLWFLCILVGCNIWCWSDDDVMLSINSLTCCEVSKLKRSYWSLPLETFFYFASYLDFPIRDNIMVIKGKYVHWRMFVNASYNYVAFLKNNYFNKNLLKFFSFINYQIRANIIRMFSY